MKKITVSDFTLKEIEKQDFSLTFREKLAIAEKLDILNIDAIELPALINSKENEVIYRTISQSVKNSIVKISVGNNEDSLKRAVDCVKCARNFGLQVEMPVSTTLMEYFQHLKAPAMQVKIGELVKLAKQYTDCVEFIACDAFRAENGFVEQCAKTAFENGASVITICDDAGEALPEEFFDLVSKIKSFCDIKVFVQTSNKLKMASACVASAIKAGADGVKTSSFGEYISADLLSDLVNAKKFNFGVELGIDSTKVKTLLASIDKLAEVETVESKSQTISGTLDVNTTAKGLSDAIKQLGYELTDADNGKVYEEFKKIVTKKEAINVKELEALVASTAMQVPSTYHLINYVVNSGNIIPATANITLEKDGEKFTGVSTGDGPIDAAFHAIEQVIGHHYELDDFQVQAVTKGRGAVGSSIIRLRANGKLYPGNGVSTDIIGACIRAYINALNKIVYEEN